MKDNYEGMLFSLNNPVAGGPPGTLKKPEITVPRGSVSPFDLDNTIPEKIYCRGNREETEMERKGLNGTTLKIIAVVSMLIDHTGLVLLRPYLLSLGITNIALQNLGSQTEHAGLVYLY